MATGGCPADDQLDAYIAGSLNASEIRHIEGHLECCAVCRDRVMVSDTDERLLSKLRAANREDETGTEVAEHGDATVAAGHARICAPEIPGYQILEEIGRGGMGVVYKAIQIHLGREVALKILPSQLATLRRDAVDRFRREASAASRLHHHNIIPIYDFGAARGAYYYSMEYISGQPLNVLIHRLAGQNAATLSPAGLAQLLSTHTPGSGGPVPTAASLSSSSGTDSLQPSDASSTTRGRVYYQQVARWMAEVAEALHYAHGQGIIHRDIKPGNLILSEDGRIMLADFGLAKVTGQEAVTMTGSLLGTICYLSPEQAMAKRMPVDHRTDIYSLGATMYELLCFQRAFPGSEEQQILAQIITREPMRPRKVNHSVPPELETICLKTLEKAADARYATARALAEDLRRYVEDLPIVAKRPGPIRRSIKFVRRHKAASIAALLGLALIITGGLLTHRSRLARIREKEALVAEQQARTARVERLVAEAQNLADRKRWEEAAALYREALSIDPKSVAAAGNFAILRKNQFNEVRDPALLDQAVDLCKRALAAEPDHALLLNIQGVLLKKLGRYDEAIQTFTRAISIDPMRAAPRNNLGVIQALAGDLTAAEETFRQAVDLPQEDESLKCEAWRHLASVQLHFGNPEAFQSIERAIACNQANAESRLVRARAHLQLERHIDDAKALLDAAMADELPCRLPEKAKRMRALAHLRNEQFTDAITHAQKAIDLGDMATVNHLILAIAEFNLGHGNAATDHFTTAIVSWPEQLVRDDVWVTAKEGVLWLDAAGELEGLRKEVEGLLHIGAREP